MRTYVGLEEDMPLGWEYPRRKEFFARLDLDRGAYQDKLKFQNRTQVFQVYRVPIDLPKYRLTNGRTQASQEHYLAQHPELPADFFTRDMESIEAQRVQHQLLLQVLGREEKDLLKYFESRQQEEPVVLSNQGFVVNGNRRLCAWRVLYYGPGGVEKYPHFSHLDAMILPECDERDIDELEAYLQIQADIKEEYTWIARACMLRARQQQHGYSFAALSKLYDLREKEIREILGLLAYVDDYLSRRGKDKQYELVEQNEFAFKAIQKERRKLHDTAKQELFTELSYTHIDNPEEVSGRLYDRIPKMREHLDTIAAELQRELEPEVSSADENKDDGKYAVFGPSESTYDALLHSVAEQRNAQLVVEVVEAVVEDESAKARYRKRANSVLKEVTRANTSLRNALNCRNEDSSKEGISAQLREIEESVKSLKEWLASDD